MRQRTLISAAAAGAVIAVAAGAAAVPRVWRRLRREPAVEVPFGGPFDERFGDPEGPIDPDANAAVRDELRDRISDLDVEPEAPVATPVEPDLIVEGVAGDDPAVDEARARLRQRVDDAKRSFRAD